MFKNLFSRFMPGRSEQPAPKRERTVTSQEVEDVLRNFARRKMQENQPPPEQKRKKSIPIYCGYPREKDHIPKALKFATYKNRVAEVSLAYAIFHGNRCVFSATCRGRGSTLYCCDQIVQMIADLERRQVTSMRYYDLQTLTGYPRGICFSGAIEFDQLMLAWDRYRPDTIIVRAWYHTICPEYVLELFREYVADSKPQIIHDGACTDF